MNRILSDKHDCSNDSSLLKNYIDCILFVDINISDVNINILQSMLKHIIILLLILYEVNCQTVDSSSYFANTVVLRSPDVYTLSWNFTSDYIVFRAVVRTSGWVGFGISPTGAMQNSDMILAFTEASGSITFRDSHTENSTVVITDVVSCFFAFFFCFFIMITYSFCRWCICPSVDRLCCILFL